MTQEKVGGDANFEIILGRGWIMHQWQDIQSIAQEILNITEGVMSIGEETLNLNNKLRS